MKKLIPLFLVLCLMLTACVTEPAPTTVPTTEPTTEATTEPTTEPTTEATTEPTTVPTTEPPVLYRHPLTGEPLQEPFTGRPVAVITNNYKGALPHHGVSRADILYEILAEGGITRFLAIYSDLSEAGNIGSVRSARTYFNSLTRSYDAILIHHGQSDHAAQEFAAGTVTHINGSDPYFFRDQYRLNSGYAYEHTLFTSGEKLLRNIEKAKIRFTAKEDINYGLAFSDDAAISGQPASKVTVKYSIGGKTNILTYNEATGQYSLNQFNRTYIDGNTGKEVTFSNMLILFAKCRTTQSTHVFHTLTGENQGYLLLNGQMVPITWHRESEKAPFTYTLEDGTSVTLKPGKTYIAVVPTGSTVTAE